MEYKYYNKKYCANCGKIGHEFKACYDPITSYGVVNIRLLDDNKDVFLNKFSKKKYTKYILLSRKHKTICCDITYNMNIFEDNTNYKIDNDSIDLNKNFESQMEKFSYYKNKILFLMVSRRFSVGFIDFIRGRYDIHDSNSIIILFEQMTTNEISYIRYHEYDDLLFYFLNKNNEIKENVLNKIYEGKYSNEYCESKIKFNILSDTNEKKNNNIPWDLNFYTKNVKPKWNNPEWGFPKGRRDKNSEENLSCACREFEEETGYDKLNYHILNKIDPIDEYLLGTNNVRYKHVYYLAIDKYHVDDDPSLSNYDTHEIGDVKWYTFDNALNMIRPYHIEKKCILTKIFMFIINYLMCHDEIIN